MSENIKSTKAERTRIQILEVAQEAASVSGIDSLTIGGLAKACGLSKSGLNAHFGSKEALQIAVIDAIADRFKKEVAEPAFSGRPGLERLISIMKHWVAWSQHPSRPGGCQLIAASFDFDGLEGVVRDRLKAWIGAWQTVIKVAVTETVSLGQTKLDPDRAASLAFGLYMAQHNERLLLGDEGASERVLEIWRNVIERQKIDDG